MNSSDSDNLQRINWKLSIEALLFQNPSPLSITVIKDAFSDLTEGIILELITELVEEWKMADRALELFHFHDNTFAFQVRPNIFIQKEVSRFTKGEEFNSQEIQLLAFIGANQPISIQEINDFLGKKNQKIVKSLYEKEMIHFQEPNPNSKNLLINSSSLAIPLITSIKFAEYMGVENNLDAIKTNIQLQSDLIQHPPPKRKRKSHLANLQGPSQIDVLEENQFKIAAEKFDEMYG